MSSKLISSNSEFIRELGDVLNRHNIDAQTNTPDYLLAEYLATALDNYQELHDATRKWHGVRYPLEHRAMHVQPSLVDGPTKSQSLGEVDLQDIDAQTRREINEHISKQQRASAYAVPGLPEDTRAAEVARDAARGKLNDVCMIPDCGCTGKAHA